LERESDVYEDVTTSASATPISASAFMDASVMELAIRAARSGSIGVADH